MTDAMLVSAYDAMGPLPGAEERMWRKLDQKLGGKAKECRVTLQKQRVKPALIAVAAVAALVLLALLVTWHAPGKGEAKTLPAATPVPEEQVESAFQSERRELRLINATVDGNSSLRIKEEGEYLARAVLPEGMAVDHWLINGEPVDAQGRSFSLLFHSEGVEEVEAVLRPEKRVTCGQNAYLQFLDESGAASGALYSVVSFEYDYTVPTTGQLHVGGVISAYVSPIVPQGMELDYWVIDGQRLEADANPRGILLENLDHSVEINAVLKEGEERISRGATLFLAGEGAEATQTAVVPDDLPSGCCEAPSNLTWQELDGDGSERFIDPDAPTPDGHKHGWNMVNGISGYCTDWDMAIYQCYICGKEYARVAPGEHQPFYHDQGDSHYAICSVCMAEYPSEEHNYTWKPALHTHYQECSVCGHRGASEEHIYVHVSGWNWVCSVCGAEKIAPPPDYDPTA